MFALFAASFGERNEQKFAPARVSLTAFKSAHQIGKLWQSFEIGVFLPSLRPMGAAEGACHLRFGLHAAAAFSREAFLCSPDSRHFDTGSPHQLIPSSTPI
jgi:hypothetical protein